MERGQLTIGADFRGLRIQSLLGRGAMGAAYLASHPILRIPLVVKTFDVMTDDLFREAHLAARISSPHVVGVVDAGVDSGVAFVVQRYVDGIDVQELVDRFIRLGRKIPTPVLVRLVADIAAGLYAVHLGGVVHRDIKPANLFLAGAGEALIGDFGVAVDPRRSSTSNVVIGSPSFIAPEVWRGIALDHRADIYALGATTHLVAMHTPPFAGATIPELALAHVETAYVQPTTADPIEALLFTLIASTLAKDPAQRPASAHQVSTLLARVREPLPALARAGEDTFTISGVTVTVRGGDLAASTADVLVNAANTGLRMREGVAAALRATGGDEIEAEAVARAPAKMGDVVWTRAGRLRAHMVAHAVAAIDGAVCIQRCLLRTLLDGEERGARSLACPALGTGVGATPHAVAAKLTIEAIRTFASLQPRALRTVNIVLYRAADLAAWRESINAQCD